MLNQPRPSAVASIRTSPASISRHCAVAALGVLTVLLTVLVIGLFIAFLFGWITFGLGGRPVAPEPAVPPEDLNFVLLEQTFKEGSPQTVFYTWLGSWPLKDVELIVKVESGGAPIEVKRS